LVLASLNRPGFNVDDHLKNLVLRDLAFLHNMDYEVLASEYIEHFAYDWGQDSFAHGIGYSPLAYSGIVLIFLPRCFHVLPTRPVSDVLS
jgi:hypothetical protein